MAGGGGGRGRGGVRAASPAGDLGKGGLPEWLRIYDGIVAMLRKTQAQAEELAAERDHLAAFVKIQHEFWVSRVQSALQQTRRADAIRRRYEAANMELLLGDKEREARCYQKLAELTEDDLDNFRTSITALAAENYELKVKLNEVESHAELNENTVDHIHSPRDLRAEIKKLKQAYMTLSSKKDKEVSALRAEKDFVWNQLRTMEKDYTDILKKKNIEAAQATEAAQKLQKSLEELQDQNKDNGIGRLQAEAVDAKNKILILEDKIQEMLSLVKDKDLEIEKLKHGQDRTSQTNQRVTNQTHRKTRSLGPPSRDKSTNSQATPLGRKVKTSLVKDKDLEIEKLKHGQDRTSQTNQRVTNQTHRKTRSLGPPSRDKSTNSQATPLGRKVKTSRQYASSAKQAQDKSRNNSRRRKVEEGDKSEVVQKRKRASPLSYGLQRCSASARQQAKAPASPAVQPLLFSPSFQVPKMKTPIPP